MLEKLFVKDKEFYRRVIQISTPIILQNVITIGVNMMDTIMLGKYGEVQLSASSLANDFINIFQILCMGMGCGAAVLTAQYWGSRDIVSLKKTVSIMLRFMFSIAAVLTCAVLFFAPQIMTVYTNEADVISKGALYFYWSLPTFFLMGISLTLTQVLRSIGTVKIPLRSSIISFFVNIFFNWVFIFGHFGMPEMQIAGAALGTVIARVVETLIIGGHFFFMDEKIRFRIRDIFMPAGDITAKYFKYSVPVMASDSLLAFGNTAVSIIIGHMGTAFTAAYAIVAVIQRFSTVFTSGIGMASSTITGNRIGEGKKEQAYHEAITLITIAAIIGILAGVFIRLCGPMISGFYDIQPETAQITDQMISAVSLMIVFQSMQSVLTKGVLRGGGDTKFCMMVDAVFLWIVSVPLGYYTGLVLHLDAFIVFLSLKADWMIKSVLGTLRVLSGKWIRNLNEE